MARQQTANVVRWLLVAGAVCLPAALIATSNSRGPASYRDVGKLVPGDWFADAGRVYVVLGAGFEALRSDPVVVHDDPATPANEARVTETEVVAAELGSGRLEKFPAGYEVRWVRKSDQAVRDWDAERGR